MSHWSVDDITQTGLLDVLPASASKYQAMKYLMQSLKVNHHDTVFAGDSGNDLSILASPIQSVLCYFQISAIQNHSKIKYMNIFKIITKGTYQ